MSVNWVLFYPKSLKDYCSKPTLPKALSLMRKFSPSVLSKIVGLSHTWLLINWNVATVSDELYFYLTSDNLNLNTRMWLVATLLACTALDTSRSLLSQNIQLSASSALSCFCVFGYSLCLECSLDPVHLVLSSYFWRHISSITFFSFPWLLLTPQD